MCLELINARHGNQHTRRRGALITIIKSPHTARLSAPHPASRSLVLLAQFVRSRLLQCLFVAVAAFVFAASSNKRSQAARYSQIVWAHQWCLSRLTAETYYFFLELWLENVPSGSFCVGISMNVALAKIFALLLKEVRRV